MIGLESKLRAVLAAGLAGVSVTAVCQELGISRDSFYRYWARYRVEGPAGLVPRSRRPHISPNQVPAALEDEIVRLRKRLAEAGLDHGAQTIAYHLGRQGVEGVPAVATIHRVLVRRGLVVPQPHKRPHSATRRFEWPQPNAAWQIDATSWVLADGSGVAVMDLLDDHSRVVPYALACPGPTAEAAWEAFCRASARFGLPANVMSDNGSCFTARLLPRGGEARFERDLRALGIHHILSSPGHPQTCGKLERFHQTLKKWLVTQTPVATLEELQAQLDWFIDYYNHQRPHRALRGATPGEVWADGVPAVPGPPLPEPARASIHPVRPEGHFGWRGYTIGVGAAHAGSEMLVIAHGEDLSVFGNGGLVRRLIIDRTRRYQPTGRPPGPRPNMIGPCS